MRDVVIAAARRTAIGIFNGGLSTVPAHELGAAVLRDILSRTGLDPARVDEVVMGQILTAGCGQGVARQAAIAAGIPYEVPATTINKLCGSGMKAVMMAAQAVRCGDAEVILAGGQENMSLAPHVLPASRLGKRMGEWKLEDTMIRDGLWENFNDYHMGVTAENLARKYEITREEQDAFACASQNKAVAAVAAGVFKDEITPVSVPQRKADPVIVDTDEGPRQGVTEESLAKLRPAFIKDGTVTAGNASSINDGAAALLICSREAARDLGLPILAVVKGYASAGVDPAIMGIGPAPATRKCLEKAGWTIDDIELIEANEAFAAQSLSVNKELGWDVARVNVHGGAIALGHPIGASGARIIVTLLHEMGRRRVHRGLATLCIGGGMGTAVAVERE